MKPYAIKNKVMRVLLILLLGWSFSSTAQCIKGNCQNGHGTYQFEDGSTFVGEFKNGKIGSKGILTFKNGDQYIGDWKEQKRHGKGRLKFASGDVYFGMFKENKFNGYGEFEYIEGDVYKGNWKDNLPNGEGTYFYADGTVESGIFVDGALESSSGLVMEDTRSREEIAKEIAAQASQANRPQRTEEEPDWDEEDEWDDDFEEMAKEDDHQQEQPDEGIMTVLSDLNEYPEDSSKPTPTDAPLIDCKEEHCHDQKGFYIYSDGSRYEGEFWDGYPEGKGKCFYTSGDRYVGGWHNHSPHGTGIMYFANGKILSAEWDHGQPLRELKASESLDLMSALPAQVDDEIKVWAVIIGVSRYVHMPVLKYSDDDAYRIYAFLKSPEGGALPDEQIRILIDEDASREKILKMLQNTLLKADGNDVVFVYFSGHGLEGSFVPIDFDGYKNLILHEEVIDILARSEARYKMCFADACHSGSLTAQKGTDVEETIDKYYNAFLDKRGGTAFMLSSKAEEFSLEDGGLRQGVFSHFLMRGMKGEADVDFDDIVTIGELYDFVHFEVRRYTGNVQTPVMVGKYDEDMPVSVVR